MSEFRSKVLRGFGWVIFTTVAGRLLFVAAAAVTTRLVPKEDFGLIAVVTAASLMVDRLSTFGLEAALVRGREITRQQLDVAWSYQFARNLVLGLLVFLAAPWLVAVFRMPAAVDLLRVAALTFPLNGLRNVGLVRLRKELSFRQLSYVDLIPMLVQSVAMVGFAWWLRSAWALVYASVVLAAASAAVSYACAPHRPRLDFSWPVARPLFGFGVSLLGNTFMQMLRDQGVVFALSRLLPVAQLEALLGYYNRGTAFSQNLLLQGQSIFWRVAYPAMAAVQHEPRRLASAWRKSTLAFATAGTGCAAGFWLLSDFAVLVVLGEQWLPIVPVMQVFGLYAGCTLASAPSEVLFQAIGRPFIGTRLLALNVGLMLALLAPFIRGHGIVGAAWAFTVAAAAVLPVTLLTARSVLRRRATPAVNGSPEPAPGTGSGTAETP